MKEIWKDIRGYDGLYEISNLGYVRRKEHIDTKCRQGYRVFKTRDLKSWHNYKGYLKVSLSKNNNSHEKFVHRLVAEAFIPNPLMLPQVNHIDGNKDNNCVDNLEWCTCKENIKHSYENNLVDAEKRASSRKDNHNVVFNGEIMNLSKFSRLSGISRSKAYNLLKKGYSIDEILVMHKEKSKDGYNFEVGM